MQAFPHVLAIVELPVVKKIITKPILALFYIGIIFVLTLSSSCLVYLMLPGPLAEEKIVIINPGTSIINITKELHEQNIIAHPWGFTLITEIYGHFKSSLKSGEYQFASHISPLQVIRILSSGQSIIRKFVIAEGATVAEIVSRLEMEPRLIGALQENISEGYLLPATYFYSFRDQRTKLLLDMKRQMSEVLDRLMPNLASDSPLKTRLEVLTLASIVEKEALFDDEKPHIAGVFINRLKIGMKLQADPTTIYAITLGKSKLGRLLTRSDLKIQSEYNTYFTAGLPPTPIACPGTKSIEAVINPLKTKDLYFVVDGTGRHKFSSNYEAHNKNITDYRKKLVKAAAPI
jgi:UPF0755 protein